MFALAARLLGDPHEAEECVQEVFLRFAEQRGVTEVSAYLFASVRHAAGARARQAARRSATHEKSAPVPTHAIDRADARAVQRALQTLPYEQREVVALKIDAELTFAEIAELLGVSLNTAASRYRYALAKLRAALEEP